MAFKIKYLILIATAVILLSGCILSFLQEPKPDRTVELFLPLPDTLEDGSFSGTTSREYVNRKTVPENGENVEYIVRMRSFGYWDNNLEYKLNLFFLYAYFFYIERLTKAQDTLSNIDSLYQSLDEPYTQYYDSTEAEEFERQYLTTTKPGTIGIRLTFSEEGDTLIILQVAPNSPAFSAGLIKGMKILKVNDSSVTGDSSLTLYQTLSEGDSGTALTMTVLHDGIEKTYSLVKDVVEFPSILLDTIGNVPHIHVFSFTGKTVGDLSTSLEFHDALMETESYPVTLLDLRSNGGGSVSEVIHMCDEIISNGVIIHQEYRALDDDLIPRFYKKAEEAVPGGIAESRKFILLANNFSASASEIFISALMEARNIPMVGATTYGKGIGQRLQRTPGKGWAKITQMLLKTRNGIVYHGVGLVPTYPIADSEALAFALQLAEQTTVTKLADQRKIKLQIALSEFNRQERIHHEIKDLILNPEDVK